MPQRLRRVAAQGEFDGDSYQWCVRQSGIVFACDQHPELRLSQVRPYFGFSLKVGLARLDPGRFL